ncbi:MAG: hypothetical protein U0791_03730 [Gemmataceae bacterium]
MATLRTIRDRAAAALDVDANAPAGVARAAFLKRLAADGFAPPEEAVWAANALAGTRLPLSEGGRAEVAAIEAEIVDRFAREYWSIPPGVRRERWNELAGQLTDADAKARMAELEAGLPFDIEPHENPLVETVATAIRDLYVLPPREFIVRRTEWLIANRNDIADLRDAAKRLRAERHEFNRLVPSLAVELARTPPLESVPPIDRVFAEAEQEDHARREVAQAEAEVRRRERVATAAATANTGSGCSGVPVYLIIGIILFAIRACAAGNRSEPTTAPRINWDQNKEFLVPPFKQKSTFTDAEIRSFNEYERDKPFTPGLEVPPRYSQWILAGRPGWFRLPVERLPGWPPPSLRGTSR